MKIADLDEHLTVNPPVGFSWLSADNTKMLLDKGTKLPVNLTMSYGKFDVVKYRWISDVDVYGVFDDQKNLLLFAEVTQFFSHLRSLSKLHRLSKIERNQQLNTQDIASAFFHYLVQDCKLKLLSDTVMSAAGTKFWKQLINRGQVSVCILDADTAKHYLITDGNQIWSDVDGARILLPEDDLRIDVFKDGSKKSRTQYRFFYLAEGTGSHLLTEEQFPQEHHRLWAMFGQQGYVDYTV